jgi:hypothetical protein
VAFNEFSGPHPRPGIDKDIADGHEGFVEFGSNCTIRAWAAGGNIGWTLPGPVWRVRFGLQADALSGDKGTTRMRPRSCLLRKTQ